MAGFFKDASQKAALADIRPASVEAGEQAANRSTSFYTEVMLLVVCLLMTLVVLVPFFSRAYNTGHAATIKTDAIVYAQDISAFYTSASDDAGFAALFEGYSYTESFEAGTAAAAAAAGTSAATAADSDTAAAAAVGTSAAADAAKASWHLVVTDGFDITLVSTSVPTAAGTMRSLQTTVFKDGDAVYTLETFKYVSSRGGGAA